MATKRGNQHLNMTPNSSRSKNSRLQQTSTELQEIVQKLSEKLPKDELVQKLQSSLTNHLESLNEFLGMFETPEEKERKRSIVVIGLEEPKNEKASERARSDAESISSLLDTLDVGVTPVSVYRMGRPGTSTTRKGPRLVKVVLPSSFYQRQTLAALKKHRQALRNIPKFQRAIVRPSLSPEELEKDRELRARLKKAREENPKKRIYIKNGQLIVDDDTMNIDGNF